MFLDIFDKELFVEVPVGGDLKVFLQLVGLREGGGQPSDPSPYLKVSVVYEEFFIQHNALSTSAHLKKRRYYNYNILQC